MFGACHVMLLKSIRLQTLMFPIIFKSGTEEEKYAPACLIQRLGKRQRGLLERRLWRNSIGPKEKEK